MPTRIRPLAMLIASILLLIFCVRLPAQSRKIPGQLEDWQDWATWSDKDRACPTPYFSPQVPMCYWPSRMVLSVDGQQGTWNITVNVYAESWVPLPGNPDVWPMNVRVAGNVVPVVARDRTPSVKLARGAHTITGDFHWDTMPQRISVPNSIGLLSLTINGDEVPSPTWDAGGDVWLRRTRTDESVKDTLTAEVYRVLADGVPLVLHTEVELTVSGKSREEMLGTALPEGWTLSKVDSPIPVAIDDLGRIKVQARAGKWSIVLYAFRTTPIDSVGFSPDAEPIAPTELVAFQSDPTFRLAEIEGLATIDASQTTFPERWRQFPVYFWQTKDSFRLVEKLRGRGGQRPAGLSVQRQLWLDEDGHGFSYVDNVSGAMQEILRLDATQGQDLGAVRIDGIGQLITENPVTGAHGVEVRTRNLNLQANGRMERSAHLPATGWQADVDSLTMTINLPPGWRLFALFGADEVVGDWLSAWTLWDLFLLLILTLAVVRLWGLGAGVIAFFAFGLSYHELGAPRMTWLLVLMPVALLRVVPAGTAQRWITAWKLIAATILILCLIPFIARQVQNVIYPQLEMPGTVYSAQGMFRPFAISQPVPPVLHSSSDISLQGGRDGIDAKMAGEGAVRRAVRGEPTSNANLMYDPRAKIQTGPALPTWSWIHAVCHWRGPVAADQTIRSILISLPVNRVITVVRLVLLLALAAIVIGVGRTRRHAAGGAIPAVVFVFFLALPNFAMAQFPDPSMLEELRERLLEPSDAFPQAADIPNVSLRLNGDTLLMRAEVHTALDVAVPMPGRLPNWSPLTVTVDGEPAVSVRRLDGFLWVLLPQGVHTVVVEGLLPDTADWEWTFQLKPRHVTIDAAEWSVTGIGPNGVPDDQLLFSRQRESTTREAAYDRKDFQTVIAVDRHLEMGLTWQAHTEVTRLSKTEKAVSVNVPLLPGERVLTSDVVLENGFVVVSLGAGQNSFSWESELPIGRDMTLRADPTGQWVERWHLMSSPVWNVSVDGLAPVFEAQHSQLVPVWHPWPGEQVALHFARPVAVVGPTVTVQQVNQETTLGARESTHSLQVTLECSLGDDFVMELDPDATITSLQRDGTEIPVRRDGLRLIVPIQPGQHIIQLSWRTMQPLRTIAHAGQITLPLMASNVTTAINVPLNRWVLWTHGPLWGPAVRFWIILPCAIVAGLILGRLPRTPLRSYEWVLLAIGLTQVSLVAGLTVVGWLFLLAWRGQWDPATVHRWSFNFLQIVTVILTFVVFAILVNVLREGLLGRPEMFIVGNGSTQTFLNWFQPTADRVLPRPWIASVSIWFYRLIMLLWALWMASALLRWLVWGWQQFSHGGSWRRRAPKVVV